MNDTIKKLRKRVLELELADADEMTRRVYLSNFGRMEFETDDDFDRFVVEALKDVGKKPKFSEPTKEAIEEVANLIM